MVLCAILPAAARHLEAHNPAPKLTSTAECSFRQFQAGVGTSRRRSANDRKAPKSASSRQKLPKAA
eukprot:10404684-Alexandrium_andersonii.AAC.1